MYVRDTLRVGRASAYILALCNALDAARADADMLRRVLDRLERREVSTAVAMDDQRDMLRRRAEKAEADAKGAAWELEALAADCEKAEAAVARVRELCERSERFVEPATAMIHTHRVRAALDGEP